MRVEQYSSFALDAMEITASAHALPTEGDVKTFLSDVAASECRKRTAVGIGMDLRLTGSNLAGGALVVDERVVHLCAFREEEEGKWARS